MEFLHAVIALFLNISMTSSALSVVTQGFLETILTSGIPLNVGSAHTVSSQPPLTLLGSPDTLMRRGFFSPLFYHPQSNGGFPYISSPTLTYTIFIGSTILTMPILDYCTRYSLLVTY